MALSEAEYKAQVILQVGDNAAGLLAANIDTLWTAFDAARDDAAHFLLAKRAAIDVMLGDVRQQVDFDDPAGISAKLDQLFKHLLQMRDDVETQIAVGDALAANVQNGAGASGTLTKTAPIMPGPGQFDPSARRYRGDPLCPPRRFRP